MKKYIIGVIIASLVLNTGGLYMQGETSREKGILGAKMVLSDEVTKSEPGEVTRTVPESVTRETPDEVTKSEPEEVTRTVPESVTRETPDEVTSSEPYEESGTAIDQAENSEATQKDMKKIILKSLDVVKKDALAPYKNCYYKNVECKLVTRYLLDTYNYGQEELNDKYRKEYGSKISGTCSEVSCTSIAEYYTRKGKARTLGHSKYQNIFSSMVLLGYGSGAYNGQGTNVGLIYWIVNKYYSMYGYQGFGARYTEKVKSKIMDYNKVKKPVLGSFTSPNRDGHSMVIAGIYEVQVTYQRTRNSNKNTTTVTYYAVNDGWTRATSGNNRLSYIRESYLTNGITVFK